MLCYVTSKPKNVLKFVLNPNPGVLQIRITSLISTPKIGINLDEASILREPWPWWDEDPMGHEIELI